MSTLIALFFASVVAAQEPQPGPPPRMREVARVVGDREGRGRVEIGEMTRDGETRLKFFEMTVRRVEGKGKGKGRS